MKKVSEKLTIFFEGPFWIGLFEQTIDDRYEVCRVVLNTSEPKDYEVYEYLQKNYYSLKFSPAICGEVISEKKINPKRMQRKIKREVQGNFIGTKAQQALKLQHEQIKKEKKIARKEREEAEKERKREIHILKKKEKHKGH